MGACEIPVGEIIFINHLPNGHHLNTQGYAGNDGQVLLFNDRNESDWRGEEWVLESNLDGTYYINNSVAFDTNWNGIDVTRGNQQKPRQTDYEDYTNTYYKTSNKKCLTVDLTNIPTVSETDFNSMNFNNISLRYPPVILQRSAGGAGGTDTFQRWILRPSGIQNSFSLRPASRVDLAVTPRYCDYSDGTLLCVIPYEGYLSQLFMITRMPF